MPRRLRNTALIVAAGLVAVWVGGQFIGPHSDAYVDAPPPLVSLAPYQTGMTLRQAFETLPAPADDTALTLLTQNTDAWAARWRLLANARESLDISYFILREDLFGAAFLGHLLKKANEGVRIRLLLDAQGTVMSFTSPRGNDWLDTLANSRNIVIKMFRPLVNRYVEALLTINPLALVASEHDKILVVDRHVGMIGGRNISAEYFADPVDMPRAFEDADVILRGKAIARYLLAAFEAQYRRDAADPVYRERLDLASFAEELLLAYEAMDAWLKGVPLAPHLSARMRSLNLEWDKRLVKYPKLRAALERPVTAPDAEAETRILDTRTRLEVREDIIGEGISRLLRSAHKSVLIQSPYLVLSEEAVAIMAAASERGVQLTIITNSPISSDNALSQAFFLEQWPELLARVPELRIFVAGEPRTVHTKLAIFDERVTLIGTYNLDPISMEVNSEIMAAVWSYAFARDAARHPRTLLQRGAPLVYEYRIERDAAGRPVRNSDGKPVVAFGPRDHSDPDSWRKIEMYWTMLRAAEKVTGFLPLF